MDSPGPLILDDVAEGAWESFQEGRGLPPRGRRGLPGEGELAACWSRALALGAPVLGAPAEEPLLRGEALRLHSEPVEVLRALGEPVLERMTARAAASQHVLLLADADGVIVHVGGGGGFADSARRLRLMEGACWNEALRGTNAIGTAAEVNRATTVRGRAHFARPYHGLVCYAAPIRGIDGRPLAVLDATSLVEATDPELAVAVADAAHALEEMVRLRAYAGAGASVRRVLLASLDRMAGPALLVEAPGRVARINPAARALFGADSSGSPLGSPVQAVLGLSFAELLDEARRAGGDGRIVEVGAGRRGFRLRSEPIDAPGGVALAVLVQLEPLGRAIVAAAAAAAATDPAAGLGPADPFSAIFAEDLGVLEAKRWARRLAPSALPVMLLAETGAGKDLFAQAIHAASGRSAGPLVAVNCGAVAAGLLESELFGYAPRAFTGADRAGRAGLLAAARGGTLFLDEVADMPPPMQVALLRVLETGTFRRVGAVQTEKTDARILCATCRDLPELVARGLFRQDLYYRLKGATIAVPALRTRSDVVALARHLLRSRGAGAPGGPPILSTLAERAIAGYPWPGNVRELKATLEVAVLVAESEPAMSLEPHHLPGEIAAAAGLAGLAPSEGARRPLPPLGSERHGELDRATFLLARSEAAAAERALSQSDWNMSRAARALGVARSTLYRIVRRYGLLQSRRRVDAE